MLDRTRPFWATAWAIAAPVMVWEPQQVCGQCPEAKVTASDGTINDELGHAVSISGDVAVAGAPYGDNYRGSAYVYRHDGEEWVEEAKLTASDGAGNDRFGDSVSISGDVALIGAHEDDDNGSESGSAYVFRYDGQSWVQETKLLPLDGRAQDHFGISVSISGDVAVVGAHLDDDENGRSSGSAWVFRFDGALWRRDTRLTAFDGAEADLFGISVSVSGDVAIVGAIYDDDNGENSGSVYVFRYGGEAWAHEAKLTASDGAVDDEFGIAVAISGSTAIVGAASDDDHGAGSGSAYVFRYDGEEWAQEAKLTASDGARRDRFGDSVSISGNVTVVGAAGDDDNGDRSGSAYVFGRHGEEWVQEMKLTPSDGEALDSFGFSVSISGDLAMAGARWDDDNAPSSGAAYVFDLRCPRDCTADLDDDGLVGLEDLVAVLDAWGNEGGPEDLDGSGTVDFGDLLIVLDSWGPCE